MNCELINSMPTLQQVTPECVYHLLLAIYLSTSNPLLEFNQQELALWSTRHYVRSLVFLLLNGSAHRADENDGKWSTK